MTLRYGMIGCGMMGQEHIRNIQLLDDTAITAIVEPDADMRAAARALVLDVEFEDTLEGLVRRDDVDCLVIVSPNYQHADQLRRIAAIRALPILCEKPLITDPADEAIITKLQSDYAAPIWVAMEYRYMPPIAALIEEAADATGGIKMLTIREHRFPFLPKVGDWNRFNAKSGGTLVEKCCHFFDLMRLILQSEPVRVMASAGQAVNHLDEVYDGQRSDIWDNGYVIVDFANGARAMLELCMFAEGSDYQEMVTALGPKGKIECFVPGPGRFWPAERGPAPVPKLLVSPRDPQGMIEKPIPVDPTLLEAGDHNGSTFYQHQRFHAMVLKGGEPEVGLNDGLLAVKIGMAAQQSALTGQAVEL
ncbi:Gfo/Idh/MocA family protein [Pseudahrensia aquimaris]|uniref:Gfo/Idh/MocA family protein n=1 Tax=Pseudahrensia aquimaris TaxID=744461 RepID=A0ABW3FDT1_9HYPH